MVDGAVTESTLLPGLRSIYTMQGVAFMHPACSVPCEWEIRSIRMITRLTNVNVDVKRDMRETGVQHMVHGHASSYFDTPYF